MSLAKWMGFGAAQNGSAAVKGVAGAADATPAELSKVSALTKGECKRFGLENFGNTCYANSVLQALYFCHPFRELVIHAYDHANRPISTNSSNISPYATAAANHHLKGAKTPPSPDPSKLPEALDGANGDMPATMFGALRSLFLQISNNALDKGTISPRAFMDKLRKENDLYRTTMHQDAHEFLIYLLNKIAEDLEEEFRNARSRSSSGEDLNSAGPSTQGTLLSGSSSSALTLVHDLFEGVLTSETRCLTCETVSARDEAFLDLSIDIEQNSSVTACLRQFSASEMLCQKNKFFCDSCCGLQEAEKRMKIKRLPNVLALHLKRFKYQEDVRKFTKLAYRVAFPLELRLFNTVDDSHDPDRLYELFAIVVHIGNGPHHGHYVAIVKSRESWLVFDDDTVDVIKEAEISKYFGDSNSGCAYVLYYQAVDLDMAALGLRPDETPPQGSASELSPSQTPLLPPGLTHEGDSDTSEIVPKTPASPTPAIDPSTPPSLTVTIPSEGSHPIPIPTPSKPVQTPIASPNGKTNFFSSIRHSPSKAFMGAEKLQAAISPPVPPLPTPSVVSSPQVSATTSQASTVTESTPMMNGKVKSPKEKSSGWFGRRKSVKPEKPPDSAGRPATASGAAGRDQNDGGSHTSSSNSLHAHSNNGHSPSLEPSSLTSGSQERPLPILPSSPRSPRPSSPKPQTVLVPASFPLSLSPSRTSNHTIHDSPQKKAYPASEPEAGPSTPHNINANDIQPRATKRPSTAGGPTTANGNSAHRRELTARRSQESFVPPLPSDNTGAFPGAPAVRPRVRDPSPGPAPEERLRWRHSSTTGAVADRTPPQAPPLTPPVTPMAKRASRKLSFSSGINGMLGFGRKDKDKDKDRERERERDRERQRSHVFAPSSMSPPSIVPGVTANGRF